MEQNKAREIIKSATLLANITGGPAFPLTKPASFIEDPDNDNQLVALHSTHGMSLLDYYAGEAMKQMCAGDGARMVADRDQRYNETNWAHIVASNAYDIAAAMIAERQKRLAQPKLEA